MVVVTHDSRDVVASLLASLEAGMSGVESWAVAVVDSGSRDGTLEFVADSAPSARRVDLGANLGYAAGVNAGIDALAPRSAAVVLNPDIVLRPGAVAGLLDALASPTVGVAVPRLVEVSGSLAWSLRRRPTLRRLAAEAILGGDRAARLPGAWSHRILDPDAYRVPTRVDWASGAALAIDRACADAVGRWDESFFLYAEDIDYGLRVNDAGFTVVLAPEVEVVHIGGEARTSPELWAMVVVNRVRLFRKHRGRAAGALAWLVVAFGEALRAGGRPASRAALAALMARRWRPETVR